MRHTASDDNDNDDDDCDDSNDYCFTDFEIANCY